MKHEASPATGLTREQLRRTLLEVAARDDAECDLARVADISARPVFLLAPLSLTGCVHGARVAAGLSHVVAAVDDVTPQDTIHGAPRWTSERFVREAARHPNAVVVDFSCSARGRAMAERLCQATGLERIVLTRLDPLLESLSRRPIFLLSASSVLGAMHAQTLAAAAGQVVASVEETAAVALQGCGALWRPADFLERAGLHADALAIDFSFEADARARMRAVCDSAGVAYADCLPVLAHNGQHAVYEPARLYRQRTLDRLDGFLALAERLEDEASVTTLYRNLLFRLSYDRDWLAPMVSPPKDEYFSGRADTATFQVGQNEHFCDCGAYQGPVIQRFLDAAGGRYASITAVEPDAVNHAALSRMGEALPRFRAINKAVSNVQEVLRFKQTGTMSSHITPDGTDSVPATRLDDELEHLTLLKMDVEGFEVKALEGAARLVRTQRPRIAACVYHYSLDLLDVVGQMDRLVDDYHFRLRQHAGGYYYDLVLYASPVAGNAPPAWAR